MHHYVRSSWHFTATHNLRSPNIFCYAPAQGRVVPSEKCWTLPWSQRREGQLRNITRNITCRDQMHRHILLPAESKPPKWSPQEVQCLEIFIIFLSIPHSLLESPCKPSPSAASITGHILLMCNLSCIWPFYLFLHQHTKLPSKIPWGDTLLISLCLVKATANASGYLPRSTVRERLNRRAKIQ